MCPKFTQNHSKSEFSFMFCQKPCESVLRNFKKLLIMNTKPIRFFKKHFPFSQTDVMQRQVEVCIFSPKIEMYIFHLCVLWPRCFDYDSWVHYRDPNPNSSVCNLLIGNRSRWSNDLWLLEMFLGKYFSFFLFF